MGQNISTQPKLSGEITLNRIRATCQRDDKMPSELKNFNVKLLANDLNALGMDIPLIDGRGHERSSDDICYDIKRITHPDIESVCMISNKRDAHTAIENMVHMFNKNYGARIQLYKDPLNKGKGKRNLAEVCDDLYLVLDKVHRKLTDQPQVIKKKLEEMLQQLEDRKLQIQSRMLPVIQNIQNARENDQTDEKIRNASVLYDATNSLLNAQLRGAYQLTANTIKEITPESLGLDGSGLASGGLAGHLGTLKSSLTDYERTRWMGDKPVSQVASNLLTGAVASGLAIGDCQKCARKLAVDIGALPTDEVQRHQTLHRQLAMALARSNSDAETQELYKCYANLAREAGCVNMSGANYMVEGEDYGYIGNRAVLRQATAGVGQFDSSLYDINDRNVSQIISQQLQGYRGQKLRESQATAFGAVGTGSPSAETAGTPTIAKWAAQGSASSPAGTGTV